MTTHYSFGSAGTPADSYRATPPSRPSQFWNDHTAAIHAHADTGAAMTELAYVDRSDAPDDQFAPLLARLEAAEPVDAGEDARVETVARAMWAADGKHPDDWGSGLKAFVQQQERLRTLAVAALAAMHPADEVERIADERAAEALEDAATTYDEAWPGIDPVTVDLRTRAASLRAASRGETGQLTTSERSTYQALRTRGMDHPAALAAALDGVEVPR